MLQNINYNLDNLPFYVYNASNAGMAELADALDLGSSGTPVQVQVLLPVPKKSWHIVSTLFYSFDRLGDLYG